MRKGIRGMENYRDLSFLKLSYVLQIIIVIPCLIFVSGCVVTNSKTGEVMYVSGVPTTKPNTYPYQPLAKPPSKVTSTITTVHGPLLWPESSTSTMEWKYGIFSWRDADKVVDKCIKFTENISNEYSVDVIKIKSTDFSDDVRYPWKWHPFKKHYRPDCDNGSKQKHATMICNKTRTIVCLQPLIVVQTNGMVNYIGNSHLAYINYPSAYSDEIERIFGKCYHMFVLKRGFAYGTRIPYDSAPCWYSPDMKILPRPVEIDSNGRGHIPVSWGEILLNKQGDQWIVTASCD